MSVLSHCAIVLQCQSLFREAADANASTTLLLLLLFALQGGELKHE